MPRVRLGNDVIVGAGAVVTESFTDCSVIAGVPARLISTREVKSTSIPTSERDTELDFDN